MWRGGGVGTGTPGGGSQWALEHLSPVSSAPPAARRQVKTPLDSPGYRSSVPPERCCVGELPPGAGSQLQK